MNINCKSVKHFTCWISQTMKHFKIVRLENSLKENIRKALPKIILILYILIIYMYAIYSINKKRFF